MLEVENALVSDQTDMGTSNNREDTLPSAESSETDSDIDPCEGIRFTENLYVGSPLSVLESHLLIFQYAVRHSLSI